MPLSKSASAGDWIKDFRKSKAPQFKGKSDKKKQKMAIAAYLEKQRQNNEELSFEEIRQGHLQAGLSNVFDKINEIKIETKPKKLQEHKFTISEEERQRKLEELANRSYSIYRDKIKPVENGELEVEEPCTHATRAQRKAALNVALKIRNGGDVGKESPQASENGGNSTNNSGSIHTGLACTSGMTIEEYEKFINEKFSSLFEEEVIEEENDEELIIEERSVIDELKEHLIELEDKSWQSIDTIMRRLAKEHKMTPKELHQQFKKEEGMIPDEWAKNNQVKEQCGVFPLDEVVRLNRAGQPYDVTLIFRGKTYRLKFFWPTITRPSKSEMERAVQKFYPTGKLIAYYPSLETQDNSMIYISPRFENYEIYTEDDWVELSEHATAIYHQICTDEGDPITPPYLIDEGVYEMIISDYDTGEERKVTFRERADDNGFTKCWKGYKKVGMKKKGNKMVNNCVKEEGPSLSVGRGEKLSPEAGGGLTKKGREKYNRSTGSHLQAPVTEKNPTGKRAARRKSFCARSRGWNGERGKAARRRWNC